MGPPTYALVLDALRAPRAGGPLSAAHRSGIGTVHVRRLPRLHRACPSTALDERVVWRVCQRPGGDVKGGESSVVSHQSSVLRTED